MYFKVITEQYFVMDKQGQEKRLLFKELIQFQNNGEYYRDDFKVFLQI